MAKGSECLNDGEMTYDNSSRIDPKRSHSHQWFMDGPEAELFPNKKQAVGVPTNNLFSGLLNPSVPAWGHPSSFHSLSAPFSERLFDSPTARAVNFDDRNLTSVNADKIDPGRKVSDDLFGNDSTFGLSMSQTLEDHRAGLSYGIRKVKVSQVKDSENVMAVSMGHGYDTVDSNTISMAQAYSKPDDSSISMGLAYNKGDDNIMSMGDTFVRENNIFISMGQPYNKGNDNIPIGQTYKENSDSIQMAHTYSKGDNNMISMGQTYKVDDNTISMGHIYNKGDEGTISMVHTYNKDDNNTLSIGQSYNKGESTIISFGGYDDDDANPSGTLLPTYGMMTGQSSVHTSEVLNQKALAKSNADTLISSENVTVSGAENNSRKKEDLKTSKKAPSNNFPSNVRSLLSTGMLDGVPVKYIAWSREELRGVIKGSGYQCSCQSCNYSKVINAYEFERHAGCKTKHPNNHIYFDNGKTIYGIVQELRSTPQNMLFEVIQTITGSPINQKCFRLWKESFLAATRELQRIYGKEEGKQLS
ncbi:putative DNA binding protein [Melia azedarach]|uniref:DNA binding protein n=1 Tax=Melia azedarach TaxID=155640 RepID=A0ACC1X0D6_MELAZ|nr:putative DNA binding protein [Melia azedarach]